MYGRDRHAVVGLAAVLGLALLAHVPPRLERPVLAAALGAHMKLAAVLRLALVAGVLHRSGRAQARSALLAGVEVVPLALLVRHREFGLEQPARVLHQRVVRLLGPGLLLDLRLDRGDVLPAQRQERVGQPRHGNSHPEAALLSRVRIPWLGRHHRNHVAREGLRIARRQRDVDGHLRGLPRRNAHLGRLHRALERGMGLGPNDEVERPGAPAGQCQFRAPCEGSAAGEFGRGELGPEGIAHEQDVAHQRPHLRHVGLGPQHERSAGAVLAVPHQVGVLEVEGRPLPAFGGLAAPVRAPHVLVPAGILLVHDLDPEPLAPVVEDAVAEADAVEGPRVDLEREARAVDLLPSDVPLEDALSLESDDLGVVRQFARAADVEDRVSGLLRDGRGDEPHDHNNLSVSPIHHSTPVS